MRKPNRQRPKVLTIGSCLLVVLLLAGLLYWQHSRHNQHLDSGSAQPKTNTSLLASLKHQTNPTAGITHLAPGLLPPTNHWFSGLVFGSGPNNVYPMPLSFQATDNTFTFGLPQVNATTNTIFGEYNPAVAVRLPADNYQISRYDEVSVTLTYSKAGQAVGNLTLAEGSPFITYQARAAQTISVPIGLTRDSAHLSTINVNGRTYGMYVSGATAMHAGNLQLQKGDSVTVFAVADGTTPAAMAAFAAAEVQSVDTAYHLSSDKSLTTLTYHTTNNQLTLFAALPTQQVTGAKKVAGSYPNIYGTLRLYEGTAFSYAQTKIDPSDQLPLANLSAADKAKLISNLQADAAATILQKTDTYYGGKELYRAANLYSIAEQLGQTSIASGLHNKIMADFADWFDPTGYTVRTNRYFYYDTTMKGLVGAQASFGSDQFNDHHFHYGYFLYAAAVMAQYDHSFTKQYGDFVNLLASDIASTETSSNFPQRRMFDPYFGHSWASGNGEFADGTNQESSSEAMNAWNGLAMWAKASHNAPLQTEAVWMLSGEAAASEADWTAPNLAAFPAYTHPVVGINWSGKRDFATFFSPEPTAIFGIQLIPMNPSMTFLKGEGSRIESNLAAIVPAQNYDLQFGDYLLMYRSLVNKQRALPAAESLPAINIDDANSRTYLLAFIMSQTNRN